MTRLSMKMTGGTPEGSTKSRSHTSYRSQFLILITRRLTVQRRG